MLEAAGLEHVHLRHAIALPNGMIVGTLGGLVVQDLLKELALRLALGFTEFRLLHI